MDLTFHFSPTDITAAYEATKHSGSDFTLVFQNQNSKVYTINMITFYIMSKKARKIISQDPTNPVCYIKNDNYSVKFLDDFFNSIKHSFTIKIDDISMKEFFQLNNDLELDFLDQSIRSSILSFLCKKIAKDKNFENEDQKLQYLIKNVDDINYSVFQNIPENIVDELIQNADLQNDDKFAQYLLQNEQLFEKYYLYINIENISGETMNNVMSKLNFEDLKKEDSRFLEKIFSRYQCQSDYRKIIKVLNIQSKERPSIDLHFIDYFNHDQTNTKYFIHYTTIYDVDLQNKIKEDKNYLILFDVVVLGGCDGFANVAKFINQEVYDAIKNFHNQNGIILFLHDVIFGRLLNIFRPMVNLIGFKNLNQLLGTDRLKMFENVQLITNILTAPFNVGDTFPVAKMHNTPEYDSKYVILVDSKYNKIIIQKI